MFNLHEEVREALREAGWDEKVKAKTTEIERHFTNTHQPFSPIVMEFIELFAASNIEGMELRHIVNLERRLEFSTKNGLASHYVWWDF